MHINSESINCLRKASLYFMDFSKNRARSMLRATV